MVVDGVNDPMLGDRGFMHCNYFAASNAAIFPKLRLVV